MDTDTWDRYTIQVLWMRHIMVEYIYYDYLQPPDSPAVLVETKDTVRGGRGGGGIVYILHTDLVLHEVSSEKVHA